MIDIEFDVFSDTPSGKDPDSYSPTLRSYHRELWSKPLPSGELFALDVDTEDKSIYTRKIFDKYIRVA